MPDLPASEQRRDLASGLGFTVFDGPQGPGFYKGGHDGQTANTMVCVEANHRCVVILSNDVRSEAGFSVLHSDIIGLATIIPDAPLKLIRPTERPNQNNFN